MTETRIHKPYEEYAISVNRLFVDRAGIRYREIQPSIHPGFENLYAACDRGVSAEDYVDATMRDFGFIGTANNSAEKAGAYNRAKAALVEFAARDGNWLRGMDGTLYRHTESGIALMRPEARDDGMFRFVIEHREGAQLDPLGRHLDKDGMVTGRYDGRDIDQALEAFEREHKHEEDGPRFGL